MIKNIVKDKMNEKDDKLLLGIVDCMFKAILLDPNNPDYLKALIHEITNIPFDMLEDITILNSEHVINNKMDKKVRSDIIVSIGKQYINIEMNKKYYKGTFNKNDNYMKLIASNFYKNKDNYLESYSIIQINFDYFNYLKNEKEISKLVYKEMDTNEVDPNFENSIKYHINLAYIKKTCYNKPVKSLSRFERYCLLLMAETKNFARNISGDDYIMKRVKDRLENLSSDEEMIGLYDAEIEAEKIKNTQIKGARLEGIEEGRAKGKLEIARNMLKMGLDRNIILEATKLSNSEIEELID